jgi:alkylation response protein AidB-like acyl-CoA dehydrogenase
MTIAQQFPQRDDAGIDAPLTEEVRQVERTMPGHAYGRDRMREWLQRSQENAYTRNRDFQHTVRYHLGEAFDTVNEELTAFGAEVATTLDIAVTENDYRFNNPRIDAYNGIGDRIDRIVHHPGYATAGNLIYGTGVVRKLATLGGMRDGMSFYFLGNHVGEAGHHCPVVCNYETARVLRLVEDFPQREAYIAKLQDPSYDNNYTSSQFLTEIQGGSDVGANDTRAWQDSDGNWYIRGEKWFCSNADAELMVISARRSVNRKGTRGLSMFLIPATKPDGSRNHYTMRRLKEKMGTRALASAEIDYHDAYAIPLGANFNLMLEKVIHHSRIALATAVLGFTSRAYQLAHDFSKTRKAFGETVLNYPLVQQNLAHIKADMTLSLAGTFALIALQDHIDTDDSVSDDTRSFARLMSNIGKSVIAKRTVDNIHHCVDAIGGNAAIENTSSMPRLLRDSIIFENWEGTHNTLYMQVLRDIHRYQHDRVYLRVMAERIGQIDGDWGVEQQQAGIALSKLRKKIEDFHTACHDLQTLKIAEVVTLMANLFYYVEGVNEGVHQLKNDGCNSKLQCAALFYREFLNGEEHRLDDEYLALCRSIVVEE